MQEETQVKLEELDLLRLQTVFEKERRFLAEEREIQARSRYLKHERIEIDVQKKGLFALFGKKYAIPDRAIINFETGEVTREMPEAPDQLTEAQCPPMPRK